MPDILYYFMEKVNTIPSANYLRHKASATSNALYIEAARPTRSLEVATLQDP
jgi:hypothetical protein